MSEENVSWLFQKNLIKNEATEHLTPVQLLTLFVFGLTEESGEVSGKFKRIMRGDNNLSLENVFEHLVFKRSLAYELGDVIWYATAIGWMFGYSLEDLLRMNIEKKQAHVMSEGWLKVQVTNDEQAKL